MSRNAWRASAEAEATAKRAREVEKYVEVMAAAGAPDDCQLTPFDCVLLRQWIMGAGNEPPAWILAASNSCGPIGEEEGDSA